jgi:DMSO/TMAO reductase YedYZ molybdopterin-dependent catalytic subunit
MNVVTRGFTGRRREDPKLPPGQYLEHGFPVLQAGPTPPVATATWTFTVTTENGDKTTWNWQQFTALPAEDITVDIHCVTEWSKLGTRWRGVSLDTLLTGIETGAAYVMARSYGGYTTNLPLADLRDGKAWIAYSYDDRPLAPEHGGPARLLVPHLYFWVGLQ